MYCRILCAISNGRRQYIIQIEQKLLITRTAMMIMMIVNSMDQSPSGESNRSSASQKFPAFYGTQRFITALTTARHLSLSWARSIQSMPPHPTSWRSSLILSSYLSLGLPSGIFLSDFHNKTPYASLLSPLHFTCPAHLILLDFITRIIFGEEWRSVSSSLCSFPHSTVTTLPLSPQQSILKTLSAYAPPSM